MVPIRKDRLHAEKIPQNRDWWYIRCASLLRKVYINGPIGISNLRSEYGGKKQVGYNIAHHKKAGGAIVRKALQQLEVAGYITKKSKGRTISDEGMKKVDRMATDIYKNLAIRGQSSVDTARQLLIVAKACLFHHQIIQKRQRGAKPN